MIKKQLASTKLALARNIILAGLITALTACGSGTTKPRIDKTIDPVAAQSSIDQLILTAQNNLEPIRSSILLEASELGAQSEDWVTTEKIINQIDSSMLDQQQVATYGIIYTSTYIALNRPNPALDWLEANSDAVTSNAKLLQLKAQAYSMVLKPIAAAKTLSQLLKTSSNEEDIFEYGNQIWDILIATPNSSIKNSFAKEAGNSDFAGWLALTLLAKDSTITLPQTQQKIVFWQGAWPAHPAATMPPKGLLQLMSITAIEKVAVLIPLSGRLSSAGHSIRDGIITAHLAHKDNKNTELQFFDTNKNDNISQLYQLAITDGATAVIGPLTKKNLLQLEQEVTISVQTLALNVTENTLNNSNLSKLGLSANDDSLLASKQALSAGLNSALVIQSNKNWSARAANSFIDNWKQHEAKVAVRTTFTDNITMSNIIKDALNLQYSQKRTKYLQDVLGQVVASDPYRRKDIDMVFIATNSQEARSLKPILAFHFAGDLPVYATSQINNGSSSQSKDMDLNDIYFGETPWAIAADNTKFSRAVNNHIKRGGSYSKNLYALGIDAYHVSQRMALLTINGNYRLQGFTGELNRLSTGNIKREPSWATFTNGLISAEQTTYTTLRKEADDVMATKKVNLQK
jgi:outer membrane PBP1 activator LpoA protein